MSEVIRVRLENFEQTRIKEIYASYDDYNVDNIEDYLNELFLLKETVDRMHARAIGVALQMHRKNCIATQEC